MSQDKTYQAVIDDFAKTGSVKQTAKNVGTTLVRAQRILITEGLWSSERSVRVCELFEQGKTVPEIAKELFISEKTVRAYMPYTRGAYGGEKSTDAERSEEYRNRMKQAANNQASRKSASGMDEIKEITELEEKRINNVIPFPTEEKKTINSKKEIRWPSVLKLRFELVAPYYMHNEDISMDDVEKEEFLKNAKAKEGIIRDVMVPGEMTLHAMHYMIQKLFGWQNSHLHHFCLSEKDFARATNKQKVKDYFELCGCLFKFPGAEMDDQFWDDDYVEGISVKTWLRSKYDYGFETYSVEESFVKNQENVKEFRDRFKKELKNYTELKLDDLKKFIYFEDPFNTLIEGLPIREFFKTAMPKDYNVPDKVWRGLQASLIDYKNIFYEEIKEDAEEYNAMLELMDDLINLRKNVLHIDQGIRMGRYDEIEEFYQMSPIEVIKEQKKMIRELEQMLKPHLNNHPGVMPFVDEIYYCYDYGDDWCVKITCVDAYTADGNYDFNFMKKHMKDNVIHMPEQVKAKDLQYTDLDGKIVSEELKEKLQAVYLKGTPICVNADGLNVLDDVGGLYGYQEFLRVINSKKVEDIEEKESSKIWAKGMGWTGRKVKPENML